MIRWSLVGFSLCFLVLSCWYGSSMVKKEAAATEIRVLNRHMVKVWRKAQGTAGEQARLKAYFPRLQRLRYRVEHLPGYWKTLHKVWLDLCKVALFQGHPYEAARAAQEALRYHPFFPNAYQALARIWRPIDPKRSGACSNAFRDIMASQEPAQDTVQGCMTARLM